MKQQDHFKLANIYTALEENDSYASKSMVHNKALVKIHGGIGDALMSLPVIKKLSEQYTVDVILRDPKKSPIGEWVEEIIQNNPKIQWVSKVHEVITGFSTKGALPMEEEWCLYHPKDIKRQEIQNDFYNTL